MSALRCSNKKYNLYISHSYIKYSCYRQHTSILQAEIWTDVVIGGNKLTGAPLVIPFHLLFLRSPVPPVESDIRIGEQGLREIGTWVWGGQSYVEL
jgi:hypothetical protein